MIGCQIQTDPKARARSADILVNWLASARADISIDHIDSKSDHFLNHFLNQCESILETFWITFESCASQGCPTDATFNKNLGLPWYHQKLCQNSSTRSCQNTTKTEKNYINCNVKWYQLFYQMPSSINSYAKICQWFLSHVKMWEWQCKISSTVVSKSINNGV